MTARPARAQEVTPQLVSVLELMTADSLAMMSEPLMTQTVMRNVAFSEETIPLSGRVFEAGKSSIVEDGAKRLNEIVGRVQSSPFAEFVVLTYPDAVRTVPGTDTSGLALAGARATELDKFIARRIGEDSARVSVRSIFDSKSSGSSIHPIAGDVELRLQNYFYNGLVPRDTGYALTAPLTGKSNATEKAFRDTVRILPGDNVTVRGTYVYDPAVVHSMIIMVDSLQRSIIVDDGSFTVNGVKVPPGTFSLRTVSPELSLNQKPKMRDVDYAQIISIDITKFAKPGPNEIAFSGRVSDIHGDSIMVNTMSVRSWNAYQEETVVPGNKTAFLVDKSPRLAKTTLEPPKPKEKVGKAIILEGVTFLQGNSTLTESAKSLLGQIVMTLKENPAIELEIGGHTDNVGMAALNRKLSLARADSVKAFLKNIGISPLRLTTKGYGPDKPIGSNKTAAGKAKNRRVEFTRTK
jgi:outer membrane protein OmpA-like peptidoglycan-associated protein